MVSAHTFLLLSQTFGRSFAQRPAFDRAFAASLIRLEVASDYLLPNRHRGGNRLTGLC